jgi:hypothetical protein
MRATAVLLAAFAALATPALGRAQGTTASFAGQIVIRESGNPIPFGRIVVLSAGGRHVDADSLGRFDLTGLPAGIHRFMLVVPGVPRSTFAVAFAKGERIEQNIEVDLAAVTHAPDSAAPAPPVAADPRAQPLARVDVTAPAPMDRRYRDFERRLKTGRGQYVTRTQIEERQYNTLQDVMRQLRGVHVDCGGGAGCFITMARAPMGCSPDYIIDEMVDNAFGPNTPIRDIEAIEVYTGPADVPGEFAGANAGCGLVVIWTRNGPPKARTRRPATPPASSPQPARPRA